MILFFLIFLGFWWAQFWDDESHKYASISLVSFSLFCLYNIFYVISFYILQYCNITVTKPGFWLGYRYIQMSCSEAFPGWILLGGELSSLLFSKAVPLFPNLPQAGNWAECEVSGTGAGTVRCKAIFLWEKGREWKPVPKSWHLSTLKKIWNLAMQILIQSLLEICLNGSL